MATRVSVEPTPEPAPQPEPVEEAPAASTDVEYVERPYADALTDAHRKVLEAAGQLPEAAVQPRRVEDDL